MSGDVPKDVTPARERLVSHEVDEIFLIVSKLFDAKDTS